MKIGARVLHIDVKTVFLRVTSWRRIRGVDCRLIQYQSKASAQLTLNPRWFNRGMLRVQRQGQLTWKKATRCARSTRFATSSNHGCWMMSTNAGSNVSGWFAPNRSRCVSPGRAGWYGVSLSSAATAACTSCGDRGVSTLHQHTQTHTEDGTHSSCDLVRANTLSASGSGTPAGRYDNIGRGHEPINGLTCDCSILFELLHLLLGDHCAPHHLTRPVVVDRQ